MESKNNWKAWLYLAPVIILMAVFTFFPIINTLFMSFLKDYNYLTGNFSGFTFDNYIEILTPVQGAEEGTRFYSFMCVALPNTMLLTIITVPLSIVIALLISIGLNSIKFLQKIFQTIFFLPYVTNGIAVGMVFAIIFETNNGIFNFLFGTQGMPWVSLSPSAIQAGASINYWAGVFAICFYIIWNSLPYKILIFLSGLQNIDKQYYEAAQIDATPKRKTIWKITVPLLSPQILYIMITSFIGAFKEYNSVIGLFGTNGGAFDAKTGPSSMRTMVFFIYASMSQSRTFQYACAAAVVLFIIIMIFTWIQFKVSKKRVHY